MVRERFDKRISNGCNRWLSLGGRFILIKLVLERIPVYWFTLEKKSKFDSGQDKEVLEGADRLPFSHH